MTSSAPYNFSIILPVRNGGAYIKKCVESILNQSIKEFNLFILDSGSTDGTIKWLSTLTDERIIIQLADEPLSITENWERIKKLHRNKWMTIIGHDDILQSNYLETIEKLIFKYPEASLYQTHFDLIDADGNFLRHCKPMEKLEDSTHFLDQILDNNVNVYGTGFMMRTEDYDKVGGIPLYPNLMSADYVLWLKLTSLSYKATASENCFSYRISQSTTANTTMDAYIISLKFFVNFLLDSKELLAPKEEKNRYVKRIFLFYCKRISRRLVTFPLQERDGLTVSKFLRATIAYAGQYLDSSKKIKPAKETDIWLAKMIDKTAITRKLFLWFKNKHRNPILNK